MKRKKNKTQIRLESGLSYLLIGKSNRNLRLSYFKYQDHLLTCKGSLISYKNKESREEESKKLVSRFLERYPLLLKEEKVVLNLGRTKVTPKYFGLPIIRELKNNKVPVIENFKWQ